MNVGSPQPNVFAPATSSGVSWRFWVMIPLVGVLTGLPGGLLMLLLHATQHFAWSYRSGEFLDAVHLPRPISHDYLTISAAARHSEVLERCTRQRHRRIENRCGLEEPEAPATATAQSLVPSALMIRR